MFSWISTLLLLLVGVLPSSSKPIVGLWRGECLGGFYDNLTYGSYIYEFTADKKVTAYMRFYTDHRCRGEAFDGDKSFGQFEFSRRLGSNSRYALTLYWQDTDKSSSKTVKFESCDTIKVCEKESCENFTRKAFNGT